MTPSRASLSLSPQRRRNTGRLVLVVVGMLLVLSGCGSSSGSASNSSAGQATATSGDSVVAGYAGSATDPSGQAVRSAVSPAADVKLQSRALIKTAAISLRSPDIPAVIRKVDGYAARVGGTVTSEDTNTNTHGTDVSTRIVLSVPEKGFQRSFDTISGFGDLVSRSSSTQDVTSRVVDVASRVTSAQDSISQLRTLFHRATNLTQVIALERELSDREANLEALQSEQRSLASSTAMSTLTVDATRPKAAPPHTGTDHAGFVTGIKQGWHGLVVFVVASAHALGLVLPLGIVAILAALLLYPVVRRFTPRREPQADTTE